MLKAHVRFSDSGHSVCVLEGATHGLGAMAATDEGYQVSRCDHVPKERRRIDKSAAFVEPDVHGGNVLDDATGTIPAYLKDVPERVATHVSGRIGELLSHRWRITAAPS